MYLIESFCQILWCNHVLTSHHTAIDLKNSPFRSWMLSTVFSLQFKEKQNCSSQKEKGWYRTYIKEFIQKLLARRRPPEVAYNMRFACTTSGAQFHKGGWIWCKEIMLVCLKTCYVQRWHSGKQDRKGLWWVWLSSIRFLWHHSVTASSHRQ